MNPLLFAGNLNKRFGMVTTLQNVGLEIFPGEVVGLAGRSGAGKTVLARILAGLLVPDAGEIAINGRSLSWPFLARDHGISLMHQEPMLAEQFDIISNIFLGHELQHRPLGKQSYLLHQAQMHEEAQQLLARLDIQFPSLQEKASNLSRQDRLLLTILQGMSAPATLRIVDDPTGQLNSNVQSKLLSLIETWRQEKTAVLFASKNLDHLFAVTERIIVLRHGEIAATFQTSRTSREEIVAAMIGQNERQQHTPVIWALDSYYKAKSQAELLQHQQKLLEKDLAARDKVNQQLLEQLSEQVRALDSANLALQNAQRRLHTQREHERKHLARELHDETIQDLLSLNYQLEEIATLDDPQTLVAELDDVRHNIRQLVANIRIICSDLRPPTIDSFGLGPALKSYTLNWSDRTGIKVNLKMSKQLGRFPETLELNLFRMVQEALNNVWKHSRATQVSVTLIHASPQMLSLTITDNGMGLPNNFDLSMLSHSGHFGLLGIGERVALLGGRLTISNQAKGGVRISVEIPHPRVVLNELS